MEQQNPNNAWPHGGGQNSAVNNSENHPHHQGRPLERYGPQPPQQPNLNLQMGGTPSLPPPPPPGPYYSSQSGGNALGSLPSLTQTSPRANSVLQQQSPPNHGPQHSQNLPLPQMSANLQAAQHGSSEQDRLYAEDMERRERAAREEHEYNQARLQREIAAEEASQRPPAQNNTVSVPLQQPVASRVPSTLHGPNGILSNNPNVGAASAGLGAQQSTGIYGNSGPQQESIGRAFLQPGQAGHHHLTAMNNAAQAPAPAGPVTLGPGQQPILNDALSYLDQVKVQFQDQPEVYNQFLDIMKDFKSQAIDTPGVITRVSTLFNGHPSLIQGFNTFLPPGYRIEAGYDNDPNTIRVTTPMGTTVQNVATAPLRLEGAGKGSPQLSPSQRPPIEWQDVSHGEHGLNRFGIEQRNGPQQAYGPQGPGHHYLSRDDDISAADQAALVHQQEQRGVSQLQSAVNVAADMRSGVQLQSHGGQGASSSQQIAGMNATGIAAQVGAQLGMEKRGPVEFNHAISYVNKIKNRFQNQPEVYKQFLEILQTYQRESKPIQDVYAQVTQLFNGAPDLLQDFKQFLPESAAQAKAAAAEEAAIQQSNVRGTADYISNMPGIRSNTPQQTKLPPMGNFAPPSVSKDNKKRRGGAGAQVTMSDLRSGMPEASAQGNRNMSQAVNTNKRPRTNVVKPQAIDVPSQSPTLVPALPHPMPPSSIDLGSINEQMAFFERAKKHIANKQSYNEFIKLCNLFSQDVIDKNTLVFRAHPFIGNNADLSEYFRKFVEFSGDDETVDNKPAPPDTRVQLSACRAYGPSYRQLPKADQFAKCSGRDELCYAVLNDEWASHPTWASEDSGFISHRKNGWEESLHRIEEERHDYDFNIETCTRTIQLLEPIVHQINNMTEEDKRNYKLPPGLGGQSTAIWQRVIKKLYDRERGQMVIEEMLSKPTKVCPQLLFRLKEKNEKWQAAQREWEKLWREQTHKVFYKSLDHQGLSIKTEMRKAYQPKVLVADITSKYEEQRQLARINNRPWINRNTHSQLEYDAREKDVILDACHLFMTFMRTQYKGTDQRAVESFLKTFLGAFYDIDEDTMKASMADVFDNSPANEEADDEVRSHSGDNTATRRGRAPNGKGLLRGVLDRAQNGKKGKSNNYDSKESTPDVTSMDEDSAAQANSPDDNAPSDIAAKNWLQHPKTGNYRHPELLAKLNEPFKRTNHKLYANTNIYCFTRLFQMLYDRLVKIKKGEADAKAHVIRGLAAKPAIELRVADRSPTEYFANVGPDANYYRQMLTMFEDYLKGIEDLATVEETLRRFYLDFGWQMFAFDKLLISATKFASNIVTGEGKDKKSAQGPNLMNLFYQNRSLAETTAEIEISYRKEAKREVQDSDLFRIAYDELSHKITMGVLKVEEATTSPNDDADLQWSAYVSSYQQMEWTEGVPHAISWPFLHKHVNMTPENAGEANVNADIPIHSDEQLVLRIDPLDYRIKWDPSTTDTWLHERPSRLIPKIGLSGTAESRKRKFEDKFEEQGLLRKKVRVEELATRLDWLEEGSVDQGVPALEVAAGEKDEEMQS